LNRVVITGLGVVSSVGQSTQDYWDSLIAGRSAFAPPTLGTAAQATGKLVGEVKGFEPAAHFESSQLSLLDRSKGIPMILDTHVEHLMTNRPMIAFYPGAELNNDPTNWCGPNRAAVVGMLKAAGFRRAGSA